MVQWLAIALYFTLAFTLGCTKGTTGFDVLDSSNVPQPLFNGQTSKAIDTSSDSTSFTIAGECDYKIDSIVAQPLGLTSAQVATLSNVSVNAPVLTCKNDGKFTFELKSLSGLGYQVSSSQTYEIQLRGVTTAGLSRPSVIRISYVNNNSNAPKRMVITSGGTESSASTRLATSSNFKATIRIDHRGPAYSNPAVSDAMTTRASSNFKLKTGAAASAN